MRTNNRKLPPPIAKTRKSIPLDVTLSALVQLLKVREEILLLEAEGERGVLMSALEACAHPFAGEVVEVGGAGVGFVVDEAFAGWGEGGGQAWYEGGEGGDGGGVGDGVEVGDKG